MEIIAVYDNGGKTVDRYTIVFRGEQMVLGVSDDPTGYMGFSNWGDAVIGRHLGKKIQFDDLPEDVKIHIEARIHNDPEWVEKNKK